MNEQEATIKLANEILDRPWSDPDDDLAMLSRQFLRALEREHKEIVICAAVRASDGKVVRGNRHHNALYALKDMPTYKDEHPHGDNQGFVTSKNRYVTRKEGLAIQLAAGIESACKNPEDRYLGGELYSEDLY